MTTSAYYDDCPPGECKNGVLCQNLEKLTFGDSLFDVVVTQDVLEHVRDYRAALREIYRVLKNGGSHVFSIPFYFVSGTEELFGYRDGEYVPLKLPIEYHGDGIRGTIPALYHFGFSLVRDMEDVGFSVAIDIPTYEDAVRYGFFGCYTFIAQKR